MLRPNLYTLCALIRALTSCLMLEARSAPDRRYATLMRLVDDLDAARELLDDAYAMHFGLPFFRPSGDR